MRLGSRTRGRLLVGLCSTALLVVPIARSAAAACPSLPAPMRGESSTVAPATSPADWSLIVVAAGPDGATVDGFRYGASFNHVAQAKAAGFGIGGDQPHLMYVAGLNEDQQDVALKLGSLHFERRVRVGHNETYDVSGTDTNQRVLQPCARLAYLTFVPGARLTSVNTTLTTERGSTEITTYSGLGGGAIRTTNSTGHAISAAGVAAGSFKVPFVAQRGVIAGLAQNVHAAHGHWRSPSGAIYELGRTDPRFHGRDYLTGAAGRWTLAITTNTFANAPSLEPGLLGAWVDMGGLRSLLNFYDAR